MGDEVAAALGTIDVLIHTFEHSLDLLIQLNAVGDDENATVGHVFPNPLGQPDHREGFTAALCVPDDAPLSTADVFLRGLDREVLIVTGDFLDAAVEGDEVMDKFQEAFGVEQAQ